MNRRGDFQGNRGRGGYNPKRYNDEFEPANRRGGDNFRGGNQGRGFNREGGQGRGFRGGKGRIQQERDDSFERHYDPLLSSAPMKDPSPPRQLHQEEEEELPRCGMMPMRGGMGSRMIRYNPDTRRSQLLDENSCPVNNFEPRENDSPKQIVLQSEERKQEEEDDEPILDKSLTEE